MAKIKFAAGDELTATKLNQNQIAGSYNAGATINGATLPVPVYVKPSDSEIYACDADVITAIEYLGFAISNSTDGNPITVQTEGIVDGFSGLTVGSRYYAQDAIGTIGTTPGTNNVLVGVAISATEILIIKEKSGHKNGNTTYDMSTTSGTQNIAHGLGIKPRKIRLSLFAGFGSYNFSILNAAYNGTTVSVVGRNFVDGTETIVNGSTLIVYSSSSSYVTGTITFDGTNIIINWVKTGTAIGTIQILWEAEA